MPGLKRLYEDSEGNPLFLVEALQPDAPTAAPKVQTVIAGRLARLSRPTAELAGVAAAIGRWRYPRICRPALARPGSSSGCSPRCPLRCCPSRVMHPSG
jgi:hypothetical protein